MRSFKTEGIVIKRRDFKDADRIITILTKDHGKLVVRANGIRKVPSRRSPHVELLNHCTLTLYSGRAFPVLTEAQMLESFSLIKEDLQKIGLAYHLCELVDGLCPENQENRQVFHLVKSTLTTLSHSQNDNTALMHNFQIELLSLLGYMDKQHFLTQQMDPDLIGMDMDHFVETIIERKLKSKRIFATV